MDEAIKRALEADMNDCSLEELEAAADLFDQLQTQETN